MLVSGARVLVTGGGSGLGRGAAEHLAGAGARVAILDLPQSAGAEVAEGLGDGHLFVPADVTDSATVESALTAVAEGLGGLDVCVNAAGVAPAHRVVSRSGDLFPLDLFEFVVRVNLIGLFDVTRRAAGIMAANEPNDDGERGLIVNVASIAAFEGQIGQAAYSASKGGVAAMTITLARDMASIGVRAVCVAPGIMDTPMLPDEMKEALAAIHVFPKRLGTPGDFASLVEFLVGSPMINGEVIRLDAATRMAPR
jgi:3-hydroxyacyl-CoA dehydrogenase/3-hydroxy-2-methylbutyryl-CoA dehydrogenase